MNNTYTASSFLYPGGREGAGKGGGDSQEIKKNCMFIYRKVEEREKICTRVDAAFRRHGALPITLTLTGSPT